MSGERILSLLLLLLPAIQCANCPAYTCKTPSQVFASDTCLYGNLKKNPPTYYAEYCHGGYCEPSPMNPSNYTCQYKNSTLVEVLPGEKCNSYQYVCGYANMTCSSAGVCYGYSENESCSSNKDCNPGLRCLLGSDNDYTCQPLLNIGEKSCNTDYDCVNSAGCDKTTSTCVEYFSIKEGELLGPSNCNTIAHTSMLCESGYCDSDSSGNVYCINFLKSASEVPVKCTINTQQQECGATNYVTGNTIYSGCKCGYNNDAQAYCSPFYGDAPGIRYWFALRDWLRSSENSQNCNTQARTDLKCVQDWWSTEKAGELIYHANLFSLYPFVQNVESCVADTLFPTPPYTDMRIDIFDMKTLIK